MLYNGASNIENESTPLYQSENTFLPEMMFLQRTNMLVIQTLSHMSK